MSRALLVALLIASPAWAATYKCTVAGKTTYQQSPCAADSQPVSTTRATSVATPPAPPPPPAATDPMRGRADLVQRATPLVKSALALLLEGRVDDYVAALCPRDRGALNAAPAKAGLQAMADELVQSRSSLGAVVDGAVQQLVFDAPGASDTPARRLHTQFDWSQGQLCLRGMRLAGAT